MMTNSDNSDAQAKVNELTLAQASVQKWKTPLLFIDRFNVGLNGDGGFLSLGCNSNLTGQGEMQLHATYAVPVNQLRLLRDALTQVLAQLDEQLATIRKEAN
jgi:hypothetical protein